MEDDQIIVDVQMDGLIASLQELRRQYEANTKALQALDKESEDYDAQVTILQQQNKVLQQEMRGVEKQIQNEIKAQKSQEDSLVQLRARLANLDKQYDSMSGMERMGEAGVKLQEKIKALHDKILGLEGATGRMQRNVGNYPEAVQPLIDKLNELTKQMDELQAAGKADSDEFKALSKQAADVKVQMSQLQNSVDGIAREAVPLKTQLKEITDQLMQMRVEGKQNTQAYQDLVEQAGRLKDAMMDTQAQIKQMASDTSALNSVLDGAKAAAGGFSVALGVMNLVGDQDSETAKEMEEAQKKLQSAIAITTGLQAVQNALQKESALMMGITKIQAIAATKAQDLYTASLGRATVAQRLFNTVAKSNPYVLLAGLILTVVGAIGAFNIGSSEQEQQLEETNEELTNQAKLLKDLTDKYDTLNRRAEHYIENKLEWAKAEGKSTKEIRTLEEQLFQNRLAQFQAEEKRLEEIGHSYDDLMILYKRNLDEERKLSAQKNDAIMRGDDKELASLQKKITAHKEFTDWLKEQIDYIDDFNSRYDEFLLQDKQRLERYKQEDEEKARQAEEQRKREKEEAKQRAQEAKARREEERKKQQEYANLTLTEEQKAEDARNELIENEFERRRTIEDTAYARQLAALQKQMEEEEKLHGKNTALYKAYLDQIESLRRQHLNTMSDIAKDEFDEEQAFEEFRLEKLKELKEELASMEDSSEEVQISKMQKFAEAYKENSQEIQEASTALQSTFSSLSSIYQQMAQDESKTEEERAAAAKKAKTWGMMQIAANSGAAMAKGIAGAMDAPTLVGKFAALASVTAAILSAVAQAKALLAESHEHGGVIGGKFIGATRGHDDVLMMGKRGELVLNADQQKTLYDIANGNVSTNLAAELAAAIRQMPAPVVEYTELQRFGDNVAILNESQKLK